MPTIDPMLNPDEKFSVNKFPGNGSTVTWNLNFAGGYIRREHVKAYRQTAAGVQTEVTLVWTGPNTVTVTPAVPTGSTLFVYRDTPKGEPMTNFSNGSIINEANLDLLAMQSVFIAAEMVDRFADVALEAGTASELAIEAAGLVTSAVEDAAAAVVAASAAATLSQDVAGQFSALLATVEDLSGVDLAGLVRLNAAQTFGAPQTFPSLRVVASGQELELLSNGTFRRRASGGAWTTYSFNAWADISGKPTEFTPAAHTHAWDAIFGKPTAYPPTGHTHAFGDLTGIPSAFPPAAHTHSWGSIQDKPNVALLDQPANFSSLSVAGTRVVAITVSNSPPGLGADGDIHFVI